MGRRNSTSFHRSQKQSKEVKSSWKCNLYPHCNANNSGNKGYFMNFSGHENGVFELFYSSYRTWIEMFLLYTFYIVLDFLLKMCKVYQNRYKNIGKCLKKLYTGFLYYIEIFRQVVKYLLYAFRYTLQNYINNDIPKKRKHFNSSNLMSAKYRFWPFQCPVVALFMSGRD